MLRAYHHDLELLKKKTRPKSVPAGWRTNAERWDWRGRALRWDEEQQQKNELDMEARRKKLQDDTLKVGELLVEKATAMLKTPLHEQTRMLDDGNVVVIQPARWSMNDAPGFAKSGLGLQQAALGLERITPEHRDETEEVTDKGVPEQLQQANWLKEFSIPKGRDDADAT